MALPTMGRLRVVRNALRGFKSATGGWTTLRSLKWWIGRWVCLPESAPPGTHPRGACATALQRRRKDHPLARKQRGSPAAQRSGCRVARHCHPGSVQRGHALCRINGHDHYCEAGAGPAIFPDALSANQSSRRVL